MRELRRDCMQPLPQPYGGPIWRCCISSEQGTPPLEQQGLSQEQPSVAAPVPLALCPSAGRRNARVHPTDERGNSTGYICQINNGIRLPGWERFKSTSDVSFSPAEEHPKARYTSPKKIVCCSQLPGQLEPNFESPQRFLLPIPMGSP